MSFTPEQLFEANIVIAEHAAHNTGVGADSFARLMQANVEAARRLLPQLQTAKRYGNRLIYTCSRCGELLIGHQKGFCYICGQAWERKE